MRLSKDNTSWRASGLVKKYKLHDDTRTTHRSKKNTAKWCRGKVGVPHVYELKTETIITFMPKHYTITEYRCTNCGRKHYGKP